ncbi:MAG TPA: tubulin-like doman-containing protein [Gemmataceae bacterium]|nr:tubulin-like doman-containing protein [Gemmataceae bacterium]
MSSPAAPIAEPLPGYRLIERIGRGGFGEVWKAEAPGGILKAIKFVYGNLDDATEDGRPADQELKALNRVKSVRHPFILSLERYDIIRGQLIIVMELADRNLWDRYRECVDQGSTGIPREELLRYMEEAAEALDLMNSHYQIQHLDIKPQNLFLIHNHVKVADFGLAKDLEGVQATLTGGITPVYAAPETFEGRVTRFCDQYSLAIVYQELLTGERPITGGTAKQLMLQHIQAEPKLAAAPACDQPVLRRALAKEAQQRFPSCSEFVQALRQAGSAPAANVTASPADPASKLPAILPAVPARSPQINKAIPQVARMTPNVRIPAPTVGRLPPLKLPQPRVPVAAVPVAVAPPEQTGPGALFPAVVVGLGQIGFMILQMLRRGMRDQLHCESLPHVRFFYVDTDPETIQQFGSASSSLHPREVYQAKLNRPSHYQKPRTEQPGVDTWINPQLLYRIPRNLATTGVRAFGRLALWDHYRPIAKRLREELEGCLAPEALTEAGSRTGLGLRTNRPRVYVISGLGGGTGSGMFLDLAYVLRYQLKLLGYREPQIQALLFLPHMDRNAGKNLAVANAFAALHELLHYSSPQTVFEATFDAAEGVIADPEAPFQRCWLLPLPGSNEPREALPALGTATGFLFRELFTPMGRGADAVRAAGGKSANFHTCGAFRLIWPHEHLLGHATRRVCGRILQIWTGHQSLPTAEAVRNWLQQQSSYQQLGPDRIQSRLREFCQTMLRCSVEGAFSAIFEPLQASSEERGLGIAEACSALDAIVQLVGGAKADAADAQPSQLGAYLQRCAPDLQAELQGNLKELAGCLMDLPGYRLPGAEEALRQLLSSLRQALAVSEASLAKLQTEVAEICTPLLAQINALDSVQRQSRKIAASREIVQRLYEFSQKRLETLLAKTLVTLYQRLTLFLPDYLGELNHHRQPLEDVHERIRHISVRKERGHVGPGKTIQPKNGKSLEDVVDGFVSQLTAGDLLELDRRIQTEVQQQFRTLMNFFSEKGDQTKSMVSLLLGQSRQFLEPRLHQAYSTLDVLKDWSCDSSAQRETVEAFNRAVPELVEAGVQPENELRLLAVPDGEAGRAFAQFAHEALGNAGLQIVPGTGEIVFHREVQQISPEQLPQMGASARAAFLHITNSDQAPPHTRGDVNWPTLPEK